MDTPKPAATAAWLVTGVAALAFMVIGLSDQLQFWPSQEGDAQAARGLGLMGLGALGLVAVALAGRALTGSTGIAVAVGLPAVLWPAQLADEDSLLPVLAGVVLVPMAAAGLLAGLFAVWRRSRQATPNRSRTQA